MKIIKGDVQDTKNIADGSKTFISRGTHANFIKTVVRTGGSWAGHQKYGLEWYEVCGPDPEKLKKE